ncbi:hypothetical protein D9757_002604 [Collybiopsis confluens]|uniref:Urea carboxylase n=1 Tax=Collybiopsis confluens TaxID=2823264 RepID=A0A8H5MDS8_9AGAR|nr:hypothetical protein D9757_002604 [Collybiopsis confluens]
MQTTYDSFSQYICQVEPQTASSSLYVMYEGEKLLIANRGEIAVRIIRTARELGLPTIAIYTPSDALAPHVGLATEAVPLPIEPGQSEFSAYCSSEAILKICKGYSATLLHPGYGLLSENADFASMVIECGLTWLGPSPDTIRSMGTKHEARRIATLAGVAVVPGSQGLVKDVDEALEIARWVGFPVMLKATAGGGGMGLVVCEDEHVLVQKFTSTSEHVKVLFQDSGLFVERYIPAAHHIEIQVFGDGRGSVVHMGERECSIQRRHQKVVEESPSPLCLVHPELKDALIKDALTLCQSIKYSSAGTVEFIVDDQTVEHFFLEMNTRIQVEHPVTEARYRNLDIVRMMINYGLAERQDSLEIFSEQMRQSSIDNMLQDLHSVEVRVYAENPYDNFRPCSGILQYVDLPDLDCPEWLRVESWISTGTTITPFFDPLLCKVIVTGPSRETALDRMTAALSMIRVQGPPNNLSFLALTILAAGLEVTVQDMPGRTVGHGVPISGPMDAVSFRLANILVRNPTDIEALEVIILPGMDLVIQFHSAATVAVTGKEVSVEVNGESWSMWSAATVPKDGILRLFVDDGQSNGLRNYIAIAGGLPDIPRYLGSKSTSLNIGGYQGRALRIGDHITIGAHSTSHHVLSYLPKHIVPQFPSRWSIHVICGPQNDTEYVISAEQVFNISWKVSASSNRMGIRLESPERISWARDSGGDGGSHPSNILDNGYSLGGLNINGDTPVILTNEGPDMGGYICLCTVVSGDMWKLGQLKAGDTIRFVPVTWNSAGIFRSEWEKWFQDVKTAVLTRRNLDALSLSPFFSSEGQSANFNPTLLTIPASIDSSSRPEVKFRQVRFCYVDREDFDSEKAGESTILIEYGPMSLDLAMRTRIHAFELEVNKQGNPHIKKFCPCIRSIMCHFDPANITQADVLSVLIAAEQALPDSMLELEFPGRRFTFPIVLNDRWSRNATAQYMKLSRKEAVYLPSNVEYLARNNGLPNAETVLEKLISSDHLVLGVGFYLACPFMVPIDPRCRLVGQKMNPSRTYTPRGATGIAGVVSAIYPIESPGGYQLFGRTLPAWQTWGRGRDFASDRPWILRPFDQIRFEVIEERAYEQLEQDFDAGQYAFKIEDCTFSIKDYNTFINSIGHSIACFQRDQATGVLEQEQREKGLLEEWTRERRKDAERSAIHNDGGNRSDLVHVSAPMSAMISKILIEPGSKIQSEGEILVLLEAMKTEIPIKANKSHVGLVVDSVGNGFKEGGTVQSGDALLLLKQQYSVS